MECSIDASPGAGDSNMKTPSLMRWAVPFAVAFAATFSGCTMKSQDTPPLTGRSELGTSVTLRTQPEILVQDGSSQSLVTITARDENGKPKKDVSIISAIFVGGVRTDFGSISARNLVTDANGEARLTYTAPMLPSGPAVDAGTIVEIGVTPLDRNGTGGFGNSTTRYASIRLIPPGIVVPPDGLQAYFTPTPSSPTDHQVVLFSACDDPARPCAPPNNPIVSYSWNFGDGASGSGRTATHSFNLPGTYAVTLTVTDQYNRSASTTQTVDVAGGTAPTASFLTSPASPRIGENVNFNASASKAAPGRTIRTYEWDFGDGEQKTTTSPITSHDYQAAGTFTVTLIVTDDVGRTAVATASVGIGSDAPTADFTFSPSSPTVGAQVNFTSTSTTGVPGRTITSYTWSWGDGTPSGSGASATHPFAASGSYNVTLTVTDSAGKTASTTKTVQVQ